MSDYDPSTALRRIEARFDGLETRLGKIEKHLEAINGQVRSHGQTLHGPIDLAGQHLGDGLVHEVRAFKRETRKALGEQHEQVDTLSKKTTGMGIGSATRRETWKDFALLIMTLGGMVGGIAAFAGLIG